MQIDNSWLQHKGTREEGGSSNNNDGRKAPSIKIPHPPPHPKCAVRKDYRIASLVGGKMRPRKKAPLSGRKTFFRLETQAGSLPPPVSRLDLPRVLFSRRFTRSIFLIPRPLTPTHLTAGANWRRPPRPVMGGDGRIQGDSFFL